MAEYTLQLKRHYISPEDVQSELIYANLLDLVSIHKYMSRLPRVVRNRILDTRGGLLASVPMRIPLKKPPEGTLTWSPPVIGSGGTPVVNFTLNNSTRTSGTLNNQPNGIGSRDLVITQDGVVSSGAIAEIRGWRHVKWIGGELTIPGSLDLAGALPVQSCTGIVHLEGIIIRGDSVADGLTFRSSQTTLGYILQLQNCVVITNYTGGEHADCIQLQNAKLDGLRIDKCTFFHELQGTFLRVGTSASDYCKNVDFRRLNYTGPGQNAYWQCWETNDTTTELKQIKPVNIEDLWIAPTAVQAGFRCVPRSDFNTGAQQGGPHRGNFVGTDALGTFVRMCDTSDIVPTGPAAGQNCFDCFTDGIHRIGNPPGGDFCEVGEIGIGYQTIGYA